MLGQPVTDSIIGPDAGPPRAASSGLSIIAGILLLLPLAYIAVTTRLQPALDTVNLSFMDWDVLSEPNFVGSENYIHMFEDERFRGAVGYTIALAVYRVLAVAFIPPLIGALAGNLGKFGRTLHRIVFALIGALVSPVALSILWVIFWGPIWGREPSPLIESIGRPPLSSPDGATAAVALLDAIITGAIALVVGGTAFMAVARGRRVRREGSPGMGVWLLMIFVTLLTVAETFVIPYLTTNGGPANSTNTFGLELYRTGFVFLRFGLASAHAVLILVGSLIVTFLVWLVLVGFNLRLSYTPEEANYGSGGGFVLSFPLLILAAIPIVGLVLWGHWLVTNNGGYAQANELVNWRDSVTRTLTVPLQTIWLIQLPVTFLAGLALGFIRPFGRGVSNFLFLLLLLMVCIPLEAVMFAWYNDAREASILNTTIPLGLPWLASGLSLIVFKMFFDGAREKYLARRGSGQSEAEALVQTVIVPALPVALVVGAVLSFASAHSVLWPLVVITSSDLRTVPVELMALRSQFVTDAALIVGASVYYVGLIAAAAVPIFVLLQIFVLDRLAILAGKEDVTTAPENRQNAKPHEDPLSVVPLGTPVDSIR